MQSKKYIYRCQLRAILFPLTGLDVLSPGTTLAIPTGPLFYGMPVRRLGLHKWSFAPYSLRHLGILF